MANQTIPRRPARFAWLTRGVLAIGFASFFSDVGYEITTALLPTFLFSVLGAPALALGLIEGVSDGFAALCKFGGGYASDRASDTTGTRRYMGGAGYLATALCTGLIGLAQVWPEVLVLRALAWMGRGFRSPIRDAILADQVEPTTFGRAYGFERSMDSIGAVVGPLLASGLLLVVGVRHALLFAGLPGLVSVVLFTFFVVERRHLAERRPRGIAATLSAFPVPFRLFLASAATFGVGNFAATFFVLRATTLLAGPYGTVKGGALAISLYTLYNVIYAISAYIAGELADRVPKRRILGTGYLLFLATCLGFAVVGPHLLPLAGLFALGGMHIGLVETSEGSYAAELLPANLRGTGFGTLAAVNGVGDTISSTVTGLLWSLVAPQAGFVFGSAFALLGLGVLARTSPRPTVLPPG